MAGLGRIIRVAARPWLGCWRRSGSCGAGPASVAPGDVDTTYGTNGLSTLTVPPGSAGVVNNYKPIGDGRYYGQVLVASPASPPPAMSTTRTAPMASPPSPPRSASSRPRRTRVSSPSDAPPAGARRYLADGSLDTSFSFARPAAYSGNVSLSSPTKLLDNPSATRGHGRRCRPRHRARRALRPRHPARPSHQVRREPLRRRDAGHAGWNGHRADRR